MNECAAQNLVLAFSEIASALIELEAMKAANSERENQGKAMAYCESDFMNLHQNMVGRVRSCAEWVRA